VIYHDGNAVVRARKVCANVVNSSVARAEAPNSISNASTLIGFLLAPHDGVPWRRGHSRAVLGSSRIECGACPRLAALWLETSRV
jgi:hypothetical protein